VKLTLLFLAVAVTLMAPTNPLTQSQTLDQFEIGTPGSFSLSESGPAFASRTLGEGDLSLQTGESTGTVTGVVRYPSDYLPAMRIYAIRTDTSTYYKTTTRPNQSRFKILNVPPGKYFIVAYTDEAAGMSGAWTRAVPCGLKVTCRDHSLIRVTVTAGRTAGGIDIGDWYAPAGAFPSEPSRDEETLTARGIESIDFRNFTYSRGAGESLVLRAGEEAGRPSDAARFVSARYVDFDRDGRKEALVTIATGTKGEVPFESSWCDPPIPRP
jgi:hypothetical protein